MCVSSFLPRWAIRMSISNLCRLHIYDMFITPIFMIIMQLRRLATIQVVWVFGFHKSHFQQSALVHIWLTGCFNYENGCNSQLFLLKHVLQKAFSIIISICISVVAQWRDKLLNMFKPKLMRFISHQQTWPVSRLDGSYGSSYCHW